MDISLIAPVYNEEQNLPLLFDAIRAVVEPLAHSWEIIFVDDGSQDHSRSILEALYEKDPDHVRVIEFRRNFGQTAAIAAGIDHSNGEVIILLDADMQNDPADIPTLLAKLDEGYDLVSGWRRNRKDNALTRNLPSHIANWLISTVTGVHLHDYGCTLKAYRRDVLEGFHLYGEMHRFIPVFAHSVGARITEVEVHHNPRKFGKAKYGLERTLKVVLDLFTVKFLLDYSSKPIYLFGGAGLVLMFLGLADLLYLFIRRFWGVPAATSPLLLVGVTFAIMGFQSILMGLIAELLVRTYHESQSKPTYRIRTMLEKKKENE
jgi:glycosyltransferase involved in cell wall biosynthesis